MKLAARIGIPLSEFWDMTIAELNIYAEAYGERMKDENTRMLQASAIMAYYTSRFVWQKRVNIHRILEELSGGKQKHDMSDDEMLAAVRGLNAMFGGKIIREPEP